MANLIPYIGPFIGAIPAIIAVFLDARFGIGWSLLAVIILTLVIQISITRLLRHWSLAKVLSSVP